MPDFLKEIKKSLKKSFLYWFAPSPYPNWKTWGTCYDYGADAKFFLIKEFCKCKHRKYSHRFYYIHFDMSGNARTIERCINCSCPNFMQMDNLDWVEYSSERVSNIQTHCSKDKYDYFEAVSKGEKIHG